MSRSDSYPHFGRWGKIWQDAHRRSPGAGTADVGETQAHVSKSICRKGAKFSGKEQGNHYCAIVVEGVLVDQSFVSLALDSFCSEVFSEKAKEDGYRRERLTIHSHGTELRHLQGAILAWGRREITSSTCEQSEDLAQPEGSIPPPLYRGKCPGLDPGCPLGET